MKKEAALVIIKPDGISKGLTGNILSMFDKTKLEIGAIRIVETTRELVEDHYRNIRRKPFFKDVISYLLGKYHKQKKVIAVVYYGVGAIEKCRKIAGATNPEEADPASVRNLYGIITEEGRFENVVHVSSETKEAEREIKLWFEPEDMVRDIYSTKTEEVNFRKKKAWL